MVRDTQTETQSCTLTPLHSHSHKNDRSFQTQTQNTSITAATQALINAFTKRPKWIFIAGGFWDVGH